LHVITAYKPPDPPRMDKLPDDSSDRVTDPADLLLEKLRASISAREWRLILSRHR